MEKDILSLRNIYRFLMVNDYPIYSTGVFKEENRKGLTLTKFWQEVLLYEFRSGYYGKMIWRTSGGRNRHTSEMCNRSEVLKWYPQYTSELVEAMNEKVLLQQMNQFKTCLQERKSDLDVLEKKIEAAISMFYTQDACFGEEIADYFQKNMADGKTHFGKDAEARLFYICWMLALLTIHAMAGEEMNNARMKKLRQGKAYALQTLWECQKKSAKQKEDVHFLTNQNNSLCITPLPTMCFFGREMELFDLRELLEQGGYYLLNGMGGIGKTELLRQLLQLCVEQKLVDEIAIIQYESSLKSGCMNAFPNMHVVDDNMVLNEAMARIRMQEGKRVLTLVDNMNNTLEEDPDLAQLLTLPGTVILTSRLAGLESFTTYEVKSPSRETSMLIFRDNYGKALSKDDKEELQELLEQEVWRHTLTLRLLGSTAKVKGWSVGILKARLEEDGSQLFKARENREISLTEMYRRMYDLSELSESQVLFLRCFAAMPYQNYTNEFLMKFLQSYFVNHEDMQRQLGKLQEYGWLTITEQGCSMHPVIKECVLFESLKEEDIFIFADSLEEYWWKKCGSVEKSMEDWYMYTYAPDGEDYQLLSLWNNMLNNLTKEITERLIKVSVMALQIDRRIMYNLSSIEAIVNKIRVIKSEAYGADIHIAMVGKEYDSRKEYYRYVWEKRKELGLTEWQQKAYSIELGWAMLFHDDISACMEFIKELSIKKTEGILYVIQEYMRAFLYAIQTKMSDAHETLLHVIEEMERIHFPDGITKHMILFQQINCCTETGKYEEAIKIFIQLEESIKNNSNIISEFHLAYAKGFPFRNAGCLKEVCENQAKAVRLSRNLMGRCIEYAACCADYAVLLCKNGQMEEAEQNFQEAISILIQEKKTEVTVSRAYNNMADMYISWNKPEQAIECMQKSTEYGKNIQGIGLAERYRNFARAYRLAGDTEKEYDNLKQAVPLLAEVYGPDHERTIAMRERLEEVEKLIG